MFSALFLRDSVSDSRHCGAALRALGVEDVASEGDKDVLLYLGAALTVRAAQMVSACE